MTSDSDIKRMTKTLYRLMIELQMDEADVEETRRVVTTLKANGF